MFWLIFACTHADPSSPYGASDCDPASCDGCCNADGRCVGGDADEACGQGAACVDCAGVDQDCDTGARCETSARTEDGQVDDATLHVRDAIDAARLRQDLIEFVWTDGVLPTAAWPTAVAEDVAAPFDSDAAWADRLEVDLGDGYVSVVYALHPAVPTGALAIVHQGHTDEMADAGIQETADFFLNQGAIVLLHAMPLYAEYTGPAEGHDEMIGAAQAGADHPLRYFLEPVSAGLNYALETWGIDDVAMIGISGGGWTTTLYAAIDPRVRASFPVAGSLPVYLRDETDLGDMEQYDPNLYSRVGFLDLYVLSGWGEGRSAVQILNRYDACCFAGTRYQDYAASVHDRVAELGGRWDVFLDESHANHEISTLALEAAVAHVWSQDGVQIADDLEPAWGDFATTGSWVTTRGLGFGADQSASDEGEASWSFDVGEGRWEVSATWSPVDGAGGAQFTMTGNESVTVSVDQSRAPEGLNDAGVGWESLGTVTATDTISVTLTDGGLADAVRVAPAD